MIIFNFYQFFILVECLLGIENFNSDFQIVKRSVPQESLDDVCFGSGNNNQWDEPNETELFYGQSDQSIKNTYFYYNLDYNRYYYNYMGVKKVNLKNDLNFVSASYSQINIYSNGYVTLGSQGAYFYRYYPINRLSDDKSFPIIAPFWTYLIMDESSDIKLGVYDMFQLNSECSLMKGLRNKLNEFYSTNPIINSVISITWENMILWNNERVSFQILFVQSESETYLLFNYKYKLYHWYWYYNYYYYYVPVLIGYTDGVDEFPNGGISRFSNTLNRWILPTNIFLEKGNTNKTGQYIYDVSLNLMDKCDKWYNKKINTFMPFELRSSNEFSPCASNLFQVLRDRNFWFASENYPTTTCYNIRSFTWWKKWWWRGGWSRAIHYCCYDTSWGNLVRTGPNAGYKYFSDDYFDVIEGRRVCCLNREWSKCSKFYEIYPYNTDLGYRPPRLGLGNGDPQILTLDGFSYAFNGYGRFILARTNDSLIEIQSETFVFKNQNNPNISSTFFNAIAMKYDDSPIIEIRISDTSSNIPYLTLYVDKIKQNEFDYNYDFNKEYPNDKPNVIVKQTSKSSLVSFDGFNIEIYLNSTLLKSGNKLSWIYYSLSVADSIANSYANKFVGLLGNLNENMNDDIFARDGSKPSGNSEREIYGIAKTWELNNGDSMLFAMPFTSDPNFIPTFADELTVSDELRRTCKNDTRCITDALLTGIEQIGLETSNTFNEESNINTLSTNNPPIVSLRTSKIQLDESNLNQIDIIIDISDVDSGDLLNITLTVLNASNYTIIGLPSNTVVNATLTIRYTPQVNEYPIFKIYAQDSKGATTTNAPEFLSCKCRNLDVDNQCDYENIQLSVNELNSVVACKCSKYYIGSYCNQTKDYCLTNSCDYANNQFNVSYTCQSFSINEQKLTNKTYYCNGTCPNTEGFFKDDFGFCIDIDECLNSSPCPIDSDCINLIGTYTCICHNGYKYKNGACEDINECVLNTHSCESICINNDGGYVCGCYNGYILVNETRCIKDQTIVINGCDTLGCSQTCSTNSENQTACFCLNGYVLNSDGITCDDVNECNSNNGGCSNNCVNTIGSFYCSCPDEGFILDNDLKTCKRCSFNKFGSGCSKTCNCINGLSCDPIVGCICISGFTGINCDQDINECLSLPIYTHASCFNTPGSYYFDCVDGYEKNTTNPTDYNCFDINECLTPNICPFDSVCENLSGSYKCSCLNGTQYENSTNSCVGINECLTPNICPDNAICINTPYSYRCECKEGYQKSGGSEFSPICDDIDECLSNDRCSNLANSYCSNNNGSYSCLCLSGYYLSNGECLLQNRCASHRK